MKQYLLNVSYLDNERGAVSKITRMTLKLIDKEDVLDAMKCNFYNFNSGIITERYAHELIKSFGLSLAHSESYHLGLSVFKKY